MGTIYGLCEPDGTLRYIGQTTMGAQVRYRTHLRSRRVSSRKDHWVQTLLDEGVQPLLVVLEDDIPNEELSARENAWINKARAEGHDLTNAVVGQPLSLETRQKMSEAHRGKPWSTARRLAHTPYRWDQASRERLSAAIRGRRPSDATRLRLKEAKAADRAIRRGCPFCTGLFSGSLGLAIHAKKTHNVSLGDLQRLALEVAPDRAKVIIAQINECDSQVTQLWKDLAKS